MAHEVPIVEPAVLTAGDLWTWKIYNADYLPDDSWVLTYGLVNASAQITITASDNCDGYHLVSVAAATTANYTAGDYVWTAQYTNSTSVHTVRRGRVTVKADYGAGAYSSGLDDMGHIKKVLDAIEDVIYGRAQQDHLSYSIGGSLGRSLSRVSHTELITTHSHYKRMYDDLLAAERVGLGLGHSNRLRVRFNG